MNAQPIVPTTGRAILRFFSCFRRRAPHAPDGRPAVGWLLLWFWLSLVPTLSGEAAKLEDRIVAVVNKDLIMLSELKRDLLSDQERLRKLYKGEELERRLKAAEAMAVTKMIERKLQLQAAKNKGLDVSDQEVVQAVAEMKKQGEQIDGADPNTTRNVREQLTLMRVVDREVRGVIMVATSEMKRYYEEHRDRFAYPEEYQLSQILIKPRNPDDLSVAQGRAEALLATLKQGESFEELALRFSDGADAARGGRLGLVRQGELIPALEQALTSLKIGEITGIVETPEGLHIVRVDDKKPRQFRPFEQVKAEIQSLVFQQKTEDQYQIWMADLKNKAYIEIKF
ncbi:MAG: PpiC-type peptidyl-prolyl cis-trans isomerase [Nitrospira sp.]|jgi:peptidyl-prolyl cis-trans isomerase SurA|nr:MAG: PpiC-type peptidyl-prolyl cis-trans isomerase [Nitrospira sp.]